MKIVVITGCLGFIGQHVARSCLRKGWYVYGVDNCTYAADPKAKKEFENYPNFKMIVEDIARLERLPDCDFVINMAAESHVGNSIVENHDFVHSNVEGVRNLLELVRNKPLNAYGRPRFVHFSTDEVYGDVDEGSFTEESVLNPSNPYSASKAAADMLIKAWARTYCIKYNIIRPTNNYGLRQYPEKLIPLAVKALQSGKKLALHNKGEPVRSWLHVEDTADAVLCILENGTENQIYNIGGFEMKNKDVVHKVIEAFYEKPFKNIDEFVDLSFERPGQDVRYSVDDTKLRSLGWKQTRFFNKELEKIVKNMREDFRW